MMIKLKNKILILICLLFLPGTFARAQKNMTDNLIQKFLRYSEAIPREEIFIHTDRTEYIAGEDLWFNIYLLDRISNLPLQTDKIAYFELLSPENKPVVQRRIYIDKGFGPGQILLPDTLSSGTYTIRAYTSWMKNFLPYNCYMKDIRVYNALSKKAFKEKIYQDEKTGNGNISDGNTVLPASGLTLTINNLNPDLLVIYVNTDNSVRINTNNTVYLFIQTHGLINHVSTVNLSSDITTINIPKKELVPGINQITIFNSNGQPAIEKYIYTPAMNSDLVSLNSTESYKIRDKIALILTIKNDSDSICPGNLSISVSPVTNLNLNNSLTDYMIFGSEFGLVPWTSLKGRKIDELSPDKLDSLLSNLSSNWIEWDKILSDNIPVLRYPVESGDHYMTGKLLTLDQKYPDTEEKVLLSTPGKVAQFQYTTADKQGNFSFRIHTDELIKDLIIQLDDVSKKHKINIESPFSDKFFKTKISPDSGYRPAPSYISKWGVNYQVNKIYEASFTGERINRNIKPKITRRFYGKPDVELKLADYIKLPVMQEIFYELLPGVSLKNKKSVYDLTIADPVTNRFFSSAPGMLVDGVIINDPGIIWNLDPEIVEEIDVVKEKYMVGDYLFYGIVNVITKAGDYSSVTLPDYAIRMPYRVLDPVTSFVSPDYSSAGQKDTHIPDFRNTLYWNPGIKTDKTGKASLEFWSSDIASSYEINVQGITQEGKIVSSRRIIRIE
jgi:hypothetical protein